MSRAWSCSGTGATGAASEIVGRPFPVTVMSRRGRLWRAVMWPEAELTPPDAHRTADDVPWPLFTERCEIGEHFETPAGALYAAWAQAGIFKHPLTTTSFGRQLGERGFRKGSTGAQRTRVGLALRVIP